MDISQEVFKFGNKGTLNVNSHFLETLEMIQAESNAKLNPSVKVEKMSDKH